MDLRWKKNKRRILVICLNLCLLVLAGLSYREDSYSREVGLSEFHVMEEAVVTAQDEAGMTFDTGGSGDALLLCGPYISVPAGRYALTVQYTADLDGAVCEIYSNQVVNEDNSRGRVFATEVLPAGENTVVIPYETEERIGGMEYKFYGNGGVFTLQGVTNRSDRRFTDAFCLLAVFVLLEILFYFLYRFCRDRRNGDMEPVWNGVALLVLALLSSVPVMNDFQTMTADHMIHYARIDDIADWMRNISWNQPVLRLAASEHSGYGYITPVMYPQLFLYFPAILRLCGCSMLMAYKIFLFGVNGATAAIAFFSFGRLFPKKRSLAFLCTSLYVMNLYRLIDLYTRGAVGEFLAMAFLPLILYGMYEIFYGDHHKWYYAMLGYTGVLQSHVLSTLMAGVFSVFLLIFAVKKILQEKERFLALCKAAAGTVVCNIWFLIPFLQYSRLDLIVNENGSDLALSGVYLSQMFASFVENTGVNQVKGSTANEMPLTLGVITLFGLLFTAYYLYRDREKKDRTYRICAVCAVMGMAALFLASVYFPWGPIVATSLGSRFQAIQYTWRFLAIAAVFLSVSGGAAFDQIVMEGKAQREKEYLLLLMLGAVVLSSWPYIDSLIRTDAISKSYCEVTREMDELYLPTAARGTKDALEGRILTGGCEAAVAGMQRTYGGLEATLNLREVSADAYVEMPLFCYPGYHIEDENGTEHAYGQGTAGVIRVTVDDTISHLSVHYEEPVLWRICTVISVAGAIAIAVCLVRKRGGERKESRKGQNSR